VLVEGSGDFKYRSIHHFTLPELTIGGGSIANKTIREEIDDPISDVTVEKRDSGYR
jgi:hypothetical protein